MNELAERFQALSPDGDRLSVLERIVQSLSRNELHAVSDMISRRSDITYRLPLELVLDIFSYLPPYSAWTLQLVCRRWRTTLSSERFLCARLAQEEHCDRRSTALSGAGRGRAYIYRTVRNWQALRLGRPFSHANLHVDGEWDDEWERGLLQRTALHGHRIAFVQKKAGGGTHVTVQDLATGQQLVFAGEAREHIICLTLTERLVAFLNDHGLLYVADLSLPDQAPRALQLPSSRISALSGDYSMVMALTPGCKTALDCLTVYSYQDDALAAYPFERQVTSDLTALTPQAAVIHSSRDVIDVFSCADPPSEGSARAMLGHMRFSIQNDGSRRQRLELIRSSIFRLSDGCGSPITQAQPTNGRNGFRFAIRRVQPTERRGECRIALIGTALDLARADIQDSRTDCYVVCDVESGSMYVEQNPQPFLPRHTCEVLKWRDMSYWLGTQPGSMVTYRHIEGNGIERKEVQHMSTICLTTPDVSRSDTAHMNGTYLVSFEATHEGSGREQGANIGVYCFDEGVPLHDGRSTGLWHSREQQELEVHCPGSVHEASERVIFESQREQLLPFDDGNAISTFRPFR